MADPSGQGDVDRQKFLEEIRKRAEEEELKRLEEEERKAGRGRAAAPTQPSPPSPLPTKEELALRQKIDELRDRLSIALDRGKSEKALEVFDELRTLVKDDSEIVQFRDRITVLQEAQALDRRTKQEAGQTTVPSESVIKRIEELLESATKAYQYEQYDRGVAYIEELLSLDPANVNAIDLRQRIEAAERLSEQIKEEEERRKAEEATLFAGKRVEETPVAPKQGPEAWGSWDLQSTEEEVFGQGAENTLHGHPKPAARRRITEIISGIHIPSKAIGIAAAIIVVGFLAYEVVDHFRNLVSLPTYSVIVLPAENAPADSVGEYIASGLTEDLIDDLSSLRDLRVFASVTSRSFRGSTESPGQIARRVGANYVLRWSVSRSPQGVGIQVDFSDTVSQQSLLARGYQSSLRELSALRLEIARGLVEKVGLNPSDAGGRLTMATATADPAAYDAYLYGRSLLQRHDSLSLASALAAFETAFKADPSFADASTALAWTHLLMYDEEADTSGMRVEKASSIIAKTTALGSRSSEMYRVNGMIEQFRASFDKALPQLELAVAASPSDAESQRRLSVAYVAKNRLDDALKAARRAVADDPRNVHSFTLLGLVQQFRGEFEDALASYKEAMMLSPDAGEYAGGHYSDALVYTHQPERAMEILSNRVAQARQSYLDYYRLGRVYQIAGKPKQDWQRTFSRAKDLLLERLQSKAGDAVAVTYLALTHTRLGEFKEATAAVTRAERIGGADPHVLYNIARVYAVRRDKQQAVGYLSKALQRRYSLATILDMDFYNLRSELDFLRTITR